METEAFKIYFGKDNEDIRRVVLPRKSFADVVEQLHQLYSKEKLYHGELRIQYEDEEGDKITVSSQGEWDEMWSTVGAKRPVKIWIVEGPNPTQYFKDGPAPEPKALYFEGKPQDSTDITGEVADQISVFVKGLEGIFPGGKILPYNLPDWLRDSGAITLRPVEDANNQVPVVDFDVNIPLLADALSKEALLNIGPQKTQEQLEKAKQYLEALLSIYPKCTHAYYNLACVQSLLGHGELAVMLLDKASEHGYENIEHMESDIDLENLRNLDNYKALVRKLKSQRAIQAIQKEDQKEAQMDQEVMNEFEQIPIRFVPDVEVKPEIKEEKKEEEIKVEEPQVIIIPIQTPAEVPPQEEIKEIPVVVSQESVKAEVVQVPSKWLDQLNILADMGFPERSVVEYLLEQHNGDVQRVIDELLGN